MIRRALIAAALVLGACGGTGGGAAPAATTAAAAGQAGGASTPSAAPAPATSSAPVAAASADAKGQFSQLAAARKTAQYKVSYKVTTSGGGESASLVQTWYVKGTKSRFDVGAGAESLSIFDIDEGSFFCTGAGGQAVCFGAPKETTLQRDPAAAFDLGVRDRPDAYDPTYEGTRTIAGQTAQCFTVKGIAVAGSGQWRVCYSSAGVPLLLQVSGGGSDFTMEATVFSNTVADADFKLPATPTKLGT